MVNILSVVHAHVYFPTILQRPQGTLPGIWASAGTAADASGVQSIVWRRRWEETGAAVFKDLLTTDNLRTVPPYRR